MANSNSDNLVALFVDYENLIRSYQKQLNGYHQRVEEFEALEWKTILDFVRGETGRIVVKRAYADWVMFKAKQRELLEHGFELVNTPSRGDKNAADIKIVIDTIITLNNQDEKIQNFFIISGDGDFIDLVHHLHAHGKIVRGMGVSDSTSNYLTKVCDEFVYYDILVKPSTKEDDNITEAEKRQVSFDSSAARQILRGALEKFGDGWFSAAVLKLSMLKIDPTFNEHNYGFEKFKAFLDAHDDLLETRHKSPVRLEVRKVIPNGTAPAIATPENLLDKYLACLAKSNLHMSPTEHRENLVTQLFEIIKGNHNTKISLTEAIEKLADDVEKETPYISYTIISETAYQVFHCNCFWFKEETTQSGENKLWDRAVTFRYGINSANELLAKCDRELLKKIRRGLDQEEKIEAAVAARLLYGKVGNPHKKAYIEKLITEIELQS
jgi:uncharacterized LabA/DUF88 family protein